METKPLLYGLIGFFAGGLLVSTAAYLQQPAGQSMDQMTSSLRDVQGDDYDKLFTENMIEHHQSAVDMARLSETRANHQQIKTMSNDIITAQEREIAEMRQWQKDWGYDTDTSTNHSTMSH